MLGRIPKNVKFPDLSEAKIIKVINSSNISFEVGNLNDGTYIVEECKEFKVVINKPDGLLDLTKAKNERTRKRRERVIKYFRENGVVNPSDFTVWVIEPNGESWMPSHMGTLRACYKKSGNVTWENIYIAIQKVVLSHGEPRKVIQEEGLHSLKILDQDNNPYPFELILSYLKWLAALEDTLYPPGLGYMGRKLAFAGYALVSTYLYKPEELKAILKAFV